ncbi:hypothetical protein D3C83_221140 [compost metagenome]
MLRIVAVDDRRAVRRDQMREEPKLCVAIGAHICVIIEMVTAEIGERDRCKTNAIGATLIEPLT